MKSQSDINSSSFEEVETRPLLLSGGRSGDVTAAGKQEFPPQHFPSLQHLSPIFISNSPPPHALLLTHSPHFSLLYFYLKLFPQISVVAPRTVNLIRGGICFGGNISPCFFTAGGKYNTELKYYVLSRNVHSYFLSKKNEQCVLSSGKVKAE